MKAANNQFGNQFGDSHTLGEIWEIWGQAVLLLLSNETQCKARSQSTGMPRLRYC
ncbi:hypothetical protein EC9_35830 [Rosistilla ulvae]|uniref:Uncharacterized protein n=1 Tax=Rosistilla ulvae TaxID=1930277 RepID=A0A517M3D9_9BACT|nr:hypothetical protein EC9_35830 [Rosistilla ulvae]